MISSDDTQLLEIFMAIAAVAAALGFWIRHREQVARDWPQASGVILTSTTLSQNAGHGRITVTPVIEYEFNHNGRLFKSSHWRLLNFSVGNSVSAQTVTSRYPVGKLVTVFVNPQDPLRSVLECNPSRLSWIPFGFAIFLVAISALAVFIFLTR